MQVIAANFGAAPQLAFNGVLVGSFYAMLAVSWGIIFSTTKTFHFAHALTFTVGAYVAVTAAKIHTPFWLAILVGGLAAGIFGVVTDLIVYRPLRKRNAKQLNTFLASLGFLIAGETAIQFIFGPNTQTLPGGPSGSVHFGSISTTHLHLTVAAVNWLLIILVAAFMKWTKYGLAVRGVESNPTLADVFGVSRARIFLLVFLIGSVLAGIGGGLFAAQNTATPGIGLQPLLAAFIAVFIGGIGSKTGAVIGGFVLGLAESLGGIVLPGYLTNIVAFVLLFIVLVTRPNGLISGRTS